MCKEVRAGWNALSSAEVAQWYAAVKAKPSELPASQSAPSSSKDGGGVRSSTEAAQSNGVSSQTGPLSAAQRRRGNEVLRHMLFDEEMEEVTRKFPKMLYEEG